MLRVPQHDIPYKSLKRIVSMLEATVYDDITFEKQAFANLQITGKEFQSCMFKNCDFSNSRFLNNKFLDCTFEGCNLSLMKLESSTLSSARFNNCKILGVIFSECQNFLFSVEFESCILDYSSFFGKKMIKTGFSQSSLKEVNFTQTNLSGSVFDQCDLLGTIFSGTDLTAANFTTAFNYIIDPELNNIKKASFSTNGIAGLLMKYQIKIV
jgi:fluoroquinolone resistance protein